MSNQLDLGEVDQSSNKILIVDTSKYLCDKFLKNKKDVISTIFEGRNGRICVLLESYDISTYTEEIEDVFKGSYVNKQKVYGRSTIEA